MYKRHCCHYPEGKGGFQGLRRTLNASKTHTKALLGAVFSSWMTFKDADDIKVGTSDHLHSLKGTLLVDFPKQENERLGREPIKINDVIGCASCLSSKAPLKTIRREVKIYANTLF